MKKLFSFVMVLTVLVTVLGFNVGSASAVSIPTPVVAPVVAPVMVPVVLLRVPDLNNLEEETVIEASIDGMTMYCRVISKDKLKCVVPKTFAGQDVTIKITINGTLLNFPVKVPEIQEKYYR